MSSIQVFKAQGDTLASLPVEAGSLDESTMLTGHGIYTVFRTYPGLKVARMQSHWRRLRVSAEMLGKPYTVNEGWLREMLRRAVIESGYDPARIRLTLPFASPDSAIISVEPYRTLPEEIYRSGVKVALVEGHRSEPQAKNSQFIEWRQKAWESAAPGIFEIMLVDHGVITEGTSSNFYAVIDGKLRTAGEGMLEGIARSILLDVAPLVLPVELRSIHLDEMAQATEAMITSASRRVVPVIQANGQIINGGRPGPIAQELLKQYDKRVEQELEPL